MCVCVWSTELTRSNRSQGIIKWNLRKTNGPQTINGWTGERTDERMNERTNGIVWRARKLLIIFAVPKQSCVAKLNEYVRESHICKHVYVECVWYFHRSKYSDDQKHNTLSILHAKINKRNVKEIRTCCCFAAFFLSFHQNALLIVRDGISSNFK